MTTAALTDFDLHLWNEGNLPGSYEKLGAHPAAAGRQRGTHFAVWAPNAERVSVIGDFNDWQPDATRCSRAAAPGIWEGFIPGVGQRECTTSTHRISHQRLPRRQGRPVRLRRGSTRRRHASTVWDLEAMSGATPSGWRTRHAANSLDAPMSIYEVHLGLVAACTGRRQSLAHLSRAGRRSWPTTSQRDGLHPRRIDADHGASVLRLLGLSDDGLLRADQPLRHAAGLHVPHRSPAPARHRRDSRLGAVPLSARRARPRATSTARTCTNTPTRGRAFIPTGARYIFNYGRHEVRSFLISNALFWLDKYHIDGLRVDAVASMLYLDYSRKEGEWIPNQYGGRENLEAIAFLRELNEAGLSASFPTCRPSPRNRPPGRWSRGRRIVGGLGFGLKWDMGWMHDTLALLRQRSDPSQVPPQRADLPHDLRFHENFVLPLSHDEVVHGKGRCSAKMPGDDWQKFANLRLLYGYMYAQPGKKLLFMGSEFGQWSEWNHDEQPATGICCDDLLTAACTAGSAI